MTAVIDGTPWTSAFTTAVLSGGVIGIGGVNNTTPPFTTIGIGAMAVVGTSTVGSTSPTNATLTDSSGNAWIAHLATGGGSFTITSLSATGASGTFSFTMVPVSGSAGNRQITNGQFNVSF